jgi:hypothetical protein
MKKSIIPESKKELNLIQELENVARKLLMNDIIHGRECDTERIMDYCEQEFLERKVTKPMGF